MSKPRVQQLALGRKRRITAKPKERSPDEISDLATMLYDVMIDEAYEKFYINNAEKPAWLIIHKYSMLSSTKSKHELWFSTIHRWQFYTIKECYAKIKEMVAKAKVSMKVWRVKRFGRTEKELFAEKKTR